LNTSKIRLIYNVLSNTSNPPPGDRGMSHLSPGKRDVAAGHFHPPQGHGWAAGNKLGQIW